MFWGIAGQRMGPATMKNLAEISMGMNVDDEKAAKPSWISSNLILRSSPARCWKPSPICGSITSIVAEGKYYANAVLWAVENGA